MIRWNFIRRQLTTTRQQSLIFILCVALSIVTLVGLNSLGESINRALLRDARELLAGNIAVDSRYELSAPVVAELQQLIEAREVEETLITSLFTVARVLTEDASLFSELKVVEPTYPFYGEAVLASGRALHDVLTSGVIIVEQLVLDRLGVAVGDSLRIGKATLTIGDVLLSEPDRPVNFFAFGPRILVASADLNRLELIQPGSRVEYRHLIKVFDERNLERISEQLESALDSELESLETFRTRDSGLQRFFDNLLFFLSLVAIFTLLLAGIGIQSALTAFLRERDQTIAIVKTMGATSQFVTLHFLLVITLLTLIGAILGLAGGFLLQRLFPILLADFLPADVELIISGRVVLESLLLSAVIVAIFTFVPVERLKDLRPSFIFRKEMIPTPRKIWYYITLAFLPIFFGAMVFWQLGDLMRTLYFVGGILGLVLITTLIAELILFLLRRQRIRVLALRQALRGLFRPRNATRWIIVTLAAALAVVFTIYLLEQNLNANFVRSYPADAPNLFIIDIQPDQLEDFSTELGMDAIYYPVVRGNVASINGEPIDREREEQRQGDNLVRQFNLSYREELLEDEVLVAGPALQDPTHVGPQVSVLDEMAETGNLKIGDTITFRIQGVPIDATVTSIRSRTEETIRPFFIFVFPPSVLESAPQTIFTAIRVPSEEIAPLQNRMVAEFPNVSIINATEAVAAFADVANRLSSVTRFLALFSILAGVLIIVSSVYATRFARIQEAIYFKVVGAHSRFVLRVFAIENLILGLISALVALLLSQVASWIINTRVFELPYRAFVGVSILMMVGTILLVMAVGLLASLPILRQRPIGFLREQTQE